MEPVGTERQGQDVVAAAGWNPSGQGSRPCVQPLGPHGPCSGLAPWPLMAQQEAVVLTGKEASFAPIVTKNSCVLFTHILEMLALIMYIFIMEQLY